MKTQIILAIIGSGLINVFYSSIFYSRKLKKELKFSRNTKMAENIENSLEKVRKLVYSLEEQEIYNIENKLNSIDFDVNQFEPDLIYQSIFNDWDSFNKYLDLISKCRSNYEKYLNCRISLNLVFIEKYMCQLSYFMSLNGGEELLPYWGVLFSIDLRLWLSHFDRLVTDELNNHSFKLETHYGKKWQRIRKKEVEARYNDSILSYCLTGRCSKKIRKKIDLISYFMNYDENIKNVNIFK